MQGTTRVQNEKRPLDFQNSIGRKQADKATQLQMCCLPSKMKDDSEGRTKNQEGEVEKCGQVFPGFET